MMTHPSPSPDRLRDLLFPRKGDVDRRLLRAAVSGGFLTHEQAAGLEAELDRLRAAGEPVVVGQYLLRSNLIRPDQLIELCELAEKKVPTCAACGTAAEESGHPEGVDLVCLGCGEFMGRSEPSPAALADGRIGKYSLRRLIARGGMGVVYEAEDPELKRVVALKVVKDDGSSAATRLHREAAIAAQLRHPNIVGIYEVGLVREEKGGRTHFIAMEFVEGKTLASLLLERSARREELLRILEEVSRAVAYAHSRGVVHRDLKPANVLVNPSGRVVLTDFGLARADSLFQSRLTESRTVLGTPAYMAPEQALGKTKEIGPRTDVYALGAILYEILAGGPPFAGSKPHELERKILYRDPIPPSRLGRKVERELEVIAFKAMEKRPERRYPSALEFSEDLARFRRGEPILARPASTLYRVRKWFVRNRAVVIAAVCVCVAVGLAAVFVPRPGRKDDAERLKMEQRLLEQMRITYEACLDAILALRRAGRVGEMQGKAEHAERACRSVMELRSDLAEPHYCLGRIYRALLRDEDALREQNEALRLDPRYAPALYEHLVLISRILRRRLEELRWEAERIAGETVEREGIQGLPSWQSLSELAAEDSMARDLRAILERDLETPSAAGMSRGQAECAAGLLAWVRGRTSEAQDALGKAIGMDPALEEAYEAMATLEDERGDPKSAVEWWTKGLEVDRGYVPHLEGRGATYLNWAVSHSEKRDLLEPAIQDFSRALDLLPGRESALLLRGQAYLSRGGAENYRAAIEDFRNVLARNRDSDEAWMWLGIVLLKSADANDAHLTDPASTYGEAVDALSRAIEKNSSRYGAWLYRARAHEHWGKAVRTRRGDPEKLYELGLQDYSEALRHLPRRWGVWKDRGMLRTELGNELARRKRDPTTVYEAALGDLDNAAKLDPKEHRIPMGRAMTLMKWGDYLAGIGQDPRDMYRRAVAQFDGGFCAEPELGATARFVRATCLRLLGDFELIGGRDPSAYYRSAIQDLDDALNLRPKWPGAWSEKGCVHGNWAKALSSEDDQRSMCRSALQDYDRAITLDPLSGTAWTGRGGIRVSLANLATQDRVSLLEEAVRDLREATRLACEDAKAWEFLGSALASLGTQKRTRDDLKEALGAYERALSLDSARGGRIRSYMERCSKTLAETP